MICNTNSGILIFDKYQKKNSSELIPSFSLPQNRSTMAAEFDGF
jgi:hypothetical protein